MKIIKNFLITLAVAAMVMPLYNGCKKGDGDPFLSLQSRKARVSGEWTIDNWKEETNYNSFSSLGGEALTSSGSSKTEINGSSVTMFESGTVISPSGSFNYTQNGNGSANAKMTFNKDGTFKRTMVYENVNSTYSTGGSSFTTIFTQVVITSGTWNFLGGVEKEYKNKERIILNVLQENSNYNYTDSDDDNGRGNDIKSYANGEFSEVWQITTLKNKEMVLEANINNSGSYSYRDTWGGTVFSDSGSSSENGTIIGTLTQK